jgi:hypothetical protein
MLYKFKSKAAGDVIMTESIGDRVLRLLDREPAATGIFEVDAMPGAIAALEAAIAADEALRRAAEAQTEADPQAKSPPPPGRDNVSLRQRTWPLIEMMKRCHAEDAPIVWGV